jgi:3D (Asp-Asp-Asp) domain-containing protein
MRAALAAVAVGAMLLVPVPLTVAAQAVPHTPEPPASPPDSDPDADPDQRYVEAANSSPEIVVQEPGDEMSELGSEEPSSRPWRRLTAARRLITATLTAYSYESCETPACITRSGTPARWGVVATDPNVIPLGSRILIDQYPGTVFIAEDTGGGVRGNHVDIWQPSTFEAIQFGRQRGVVTVLE